MGWDLVIWRLASNEASKMQNKYLSQHKLQLFIIKSRVFCIINSFIFLDTIQKYIPQIYQQSTRMKLGETLRKQRGEPIVPTESEANFSEWFAAQREFNAYTMHVEIENGGQCSRMGWNVVWLFLLMVYLPLVQTISRVEIKLIG